MTDITIPENPTVDLSKITKTPTTLGKTTSLTIQNKPLHDTFEGNMVYLKELQHTGQEAIMHTYWHMGRIISGMSDNSKYGDRVIENACKVLGLGSSTLHDTVRFYRTFKNEEDVKELSSNKNVGWAKVKQALRVKQPLQQAKLIEKIKSTPLTVTQTAELVDALNVGQIQKMEKNNKKKQKKYAPKSYFASIDNKLTRHKKTLAGMTVELSAFFADLEGVVQNMDREELSQEKWREHLIEFQKVTDKANELSDMCDSLKDKTLATLIDRFDTYYKDRVDTA